MVDATEAATVAKLLHQLLTKIGLRLKIGVNLSIDRVRGGREKHSYVCYLKDLA